MSRGRYSVHIYADIYADGVIWWLTCFRTGRQTMERHGPFESREDAERYLALLTLAGDGP